MRKTLAAVLAVVSCAPFLPGAACAATAPGAVALAGTFARGAKANPDYLLKVVFTPAPGKQNEWSVVFTCDWQKKPKTFSGTSMGDLQSGPVAGNVTLSGAKRTWRFSGEARDGVVTCKHWETTSGTEKATGSFTIKKPEPPTKQG